ncbi:MAG TPA: carboxypeptidase-like regulatory domain-containing protein [Candidatus Thermoplasmatota archaeon]|nr:carboxypeptidase-like regulatory domain-containing protein [Candidatus Thermoplasmatota archaeon]
MKGVAVFAVALLLSGCAGPAPVPPGVPLDENGDPLPTLHGVVVDEAIRPVAGAVVRFLASGLNTTTDAAGRYEFHRPTMKAEAVLVTAYKDGFVPRTQQVQLSGSRSAKVNFGLTADRYAFPRLDVLEHSGLVRCTAAIAALGQAQGAGCDEARPDADDKLPEWIWGLYPHPGLAGAVVEVHWEAQTGLAQRLHAWITAPVAGGREGEVRASATGTTPLRLEVPAAVAQGLPEWTAVWLHVELANEGSGAGAVQDQPFDAYAALAYVEPLPPDYRFG